jgi:hypothetical protein
MRFSASAASPFRPFVAGTLTPSPSPIEGEGKRCTLTPALSQREREEDLALHVLRDVGGLLDREDGARGAADDGFRNAAH